MNDEEVSVNRTELSASKNPIFGHDMVVIGASSGGIESLRELFGHFPSEMKASILVVLHRSPHGAEGLLARILSHVSNMVVRDAIDEEPLALSRIYLAPPDRHLVLEDSVVRITRGPKENFVRPCVDVLFRSAAVAYGTRVIGVVLTGDLDDGTDGLHAIKRCGGLAVVQDPADALFSEMPMNACSRVRIDHKATLAELPALLCKLVNQPAPPAQPIPGDLRAEVRMMSDPYDTLKKEKPVWTPYVCPECGGAMHEVPQSDPPRYRCHVGHAFSEKTLLADQSETTERTLWAAIRALEERADLLNRMSTHSHQRGRDITATEYGQQAKESQAYAENIRQWFNGQK